MTLGELLKIAGVDVKYTLACFGQADASTEIYVNGAPVRNAYMVRGASGGHTVLNRLVLEYDVMGKVEE